MAMTPYPAADMTKENPSILVSSDGNTWAAPDGLTNPVIAYPGAGKHNADAELIFGQDGNLWLYYMERTIATNSNTIKVVSSADGVTWGEPADLFSGTLLASPAVIWDGSQYVMWYVDASSSPYKLYRRTCATPSGTWSEAGQCTITTPIGYDVWHINIELSGSIYYMMLTACRAGTNGTESRLYMATSTNGTVWAIDRTDPPLLSISSGWDSTNIYRAATKKTVTGFDLWYSAANVSNVWRIGRTTIMLA
jgi:hypothetical protein